MNDPFFSHNQGLGALGCIAPTADGMVMGLIAFSSNITKEVKVESLTPPILNKLW